MILLDEHLTLYMVVGGFFILLGVALSTGLLFKLKIHKRVT